MTGYSIELKIVSYETPKALKVFVAFIAIVLLRFPTATFLAERGILKSQESTIMLSIAFIFFIAVVLTLIFTVTNSEHQFLKTYMKGKNLKISMMLTFILLLSLYPVTRETRTHPKQRVESLKILK